MLLASRTIKVFGNSAQRKALVPTINNITILIMVPTVKLDHAALYFREM